MGDYAAAARSFEESLRLARELTDKYMISLSLWGIGIVKREAGDLTGSKTLMQESLELARHLDDKRLISLRLNTLGEIARLDAEYAAAIEFYREALAIARQESFKYLIPVPAGNLAAAACQLGDYGRALAYNIDALRENEEMGDRIQIGTNLNVSAVLAVVAGDMEKAARIWGKVRSMFDGVGYKEEKVDREFIEPFMGKARRAMGIDKFAAAFKDGQTMKLEEAIALARTTTVS